MSNVEYQESKPNIMQFNKIGDYIQGTLVDVSDTTTKDAYGNLKRIYSFKADGGEFLAARKDESTGKSVLDKERTKIGKGEDYLVFIKHNQGVVIGEMKKIKLGQKVKLGLTELKDVGKGNPAKIIKVYPGINADGKPFMDEEWVASQQEPGADFGDFPEDK